MRLVSFASQDGQLLAKGSDLEKQVLTACNIMNRMAALGMPISRKVGA